MSLYQLQKTAIVLIDPFNDFLSEGGNFIPWQKKQWKETKSLRI
ncbi:hypothetical protein ACTJIV_10495 [Chryseobacterium sp. 22532]